MRQTIVPAGSSVERYGPGEEVFQTQAGDFILTHGDALFNKLIRFGQNMRFRGKDRIYAHWDHAALIVDEKGGLIEATGQGVCRANITKYRLTEYHLIRLGNTVNDTDRAEAVAFAEWCLGEPYGWTTIICIALGLITGGKLTFGFSGQKICSGLVARSMERSSAIFNREPEDIMPADLAKYYKVEQSLPIPTDQQDIA